MDESVLIFKQIILLSKKVVNKVATYKHKHKLKKKIFCIMTVLFKECIIFFVDDNYTIIL